MLLMLYYLENTIKIWCMAKCMKLVIVKVYDTIGSNKVEDDLSFR